MLTATAALNQERQEQENVDREHREKNLFESFAPIELRVTDQYTGNLKWI
ncbi:MAG TPA: hypothetical protein VG938_14205 [Verrucomicrobiae bacterium]|nr:hypothetical protein [Verrucomicrobiae bacterium]